MKYFKKLVGERIYLSPINQEDYLTYTRWMNDKNITNNLGNTSFINTIEGEKEWLNKKDNDVNLAIVLKENDELIGNISLMDIDQINRKATLGIFIGELKYRSNGYGKEAINLILDFAFNYQNLHSVDLNVFSFNELAINCYLKVGFKEYGRRHDSYFLNGKYYDEIKMEILENDFKIN